MTKLNTKAILVQLQVSQWTARKYDKRATEQVAVSNNADVQAGRYNKSLLPMTDALKRIHQKTTVIRTDYYKNTLPWGIDGTQLLPTANYMDFNRRFKKHRNEWFALVGEFLGDYIKHRDNAKSFLGDMYDESDYPTQQELSNKFNIDLALFPVPESDFRVEINDEELLKIQQDVERRVASAQETAMREVWHRLYERVEHMLEKLSDPSAIFRNSMMESTQELCELLPKLNITDDPELTKMRNAVEFRLTRFDADDLRRDLDLRKQVAEDADSIMRKMRGFMGTA